MDKFKKSQDIYNEYKEYVLPVIPIEKPIILQGSGMYVYDLDGNKIMDLNGGQFCTIFGHSNDKFAEMMKNIANSIQHTNTSTLTLKTLEALKEINEVMPELNPQSIFLATGSEAIEFALRYAKFATKRKGVVAFDIGYHGLTLGSQSVTFGGIYANPIVEEIFTIKTPKDNNSNDIILEEFEAICKNNEIAAVVLEPIVSVGGMYVQTTDFLSKIKEICEKHQILLIFDECQTGFGRTGEWFAYQKIGVVPDILVSAKGIGLGYPVSLVAIKDEVAKNYPCPVHYSSHQNDPFSAEIVSFGINYINEYHLLTQVKKMGNYFKEQLEKLSKESKYYSSPRGEGLMLGCDLIIDGYTDYRELSAKFREYLLSEENLMIQATNGGQTLRFLPAYTITEEEIDFVVEKLKKISEFLECYRKW